MRLNFLSVIRRRRLAGFAELEMNALLQNLTSPDQPLDVIDVTH